MTVVDWLDDDDGGGHLIHPRGVPMAQGETLGAWRAIDGAEVVRRQDSAWSAGLVAPFPVAWAGRLLDRWRREWTPGARAPANLAMLGRVEAINRANMAGVPADAGDAEICQVAADTARDMGRRLEQRHVITQAEGWPARAVGRGEGAELLAVWAEALHWLDARGLLALGLRMRGRIASCLRRVSCPRWWRRVLRRIHAQAVEGTARAIGLVHKRAGCYVSDDAARRRAAQITRNARALESVEAVNEHGQRHTIAELAAKGPANREIRRHELMTRIAGFEAIARDCGHVAFFVTVTCPSRMHAWRTRPGSTWATEANPKWDGTTPDQAQQHLQGQWAKFRAAAARAGLDIYGFRIAEPNHDGTPHWHALLFFPEVAAAHAGRVGGAGGRATRKPAGVGLERPAYRVAVRLLRRYFLWQCDPEERGARRHRVTVERIDWTRGSAAGYVAKYVAKNIDGYKVEKDLYGNDCLTASRRVDAWASTWRVRQFQQVGGAPVGVWRELRRLHPDQEGASVAVAMGLEAVNLASAMAGAEVEAIRRHTAAHGWATYTMLQGGTRVRRQALRLRVLREQSGEIGRYGECMAPRVVGVVGAEAVIERRPALGIVPALEVRRQVVTEVESERADWIVVPKGAPDPGRVRGARSAAPWSPVNNCTRPPAADLPAIEAAHHMRRAGLLDMAADRIAAPTVQRHRKRGRWVEWQKRGGRGSETKGGQHGQQDDRAHRVP